MRSSCVKGAESKSGKQLRTVLTRKSTRLLSESKRKNKPTQVTARRNHKKMPAVGMRRATTVFGVVKGADGARVLRSGRRLWPDSGEAKLKKPNDGNDWFNPVKSKGNDKNSGFKRAHVHNQIDLSELPVTGSDNDKENYETLPKETILQTTDSDRMFRLVYKRKRKRRQNVSTESEENIFSLGDKRFELKYFRRTRRKKTDPEVGFSAQRGNVLTISMDSSCSSSISFSLAGFIYSVLSYIRRSGLKMKQLSSFVLSEPISRAFDSNGIHFLQGHQSTISSGICMFYGDVKYRPLFSVDFSAIPLCFIYMHSRMLLRVSYQQIVLENQLMDVKNRTESSLSVSPEVKHHENTSVLHPIFRASKLVCRNSQFRYGLGSRGVQKRRSSLRRRKAGDPPCFGPQKVNGSLISEFINARKNHRQQPWVSTAINFREASFITVGSSSTQSMDSCSCSANLLVTESDKCYRERGVTVMLETSRSRELVLVVKRDGLTKYILKAEKFIRPFSTNRFTHAIMWSGDNNSSWKLEFTDRNDWVIFKNLHKECSDSNLSASSDKTSDKTIPVPGIRIVSDCVDSNNIRFQRPDSYIVVCSDELSRAMEKRAANYDMDSDDEEWLNKVNNEFQARSEIHECLSEEDFEFMIDAFEKRFFYSPDILSDEKAAANLCSDLGREEVVGAVLNYWVKKRKQKKSSSLLRVFQVRQAKREQDTKKPPSRKKRSHKQQPSKARRDNKLRMLRSIVGEEKLDILEEEEEEEDEEIAMIKAKEATALAKRKIEIATHKREKAQLLMDRADLAAYKAMMALGIARGAQMTGSLESAASHFLLD